ncbi:hypothetical protein LXL04_029612 [Taraxacum kok-saghyz]
MNQFDFLIESIRKCNVNNLNFWKLIWYESVTKRLQNRLTQQVMTFWNLEGEDRETFVKLMLEESTT